MNIVILPSWYKRHDNSTLGSFFREQAIALANSNHNITIIYCNNISKADVHHYTDINESYVDEGVNTIIKNKKTVRKLGRLTFIVTMLNLISKHRKYQNIDLIHAHSFKAGFVAAIAKRLFGIPYVITEHSTKFSRNIISTSEEFMIKVALKNSSGVIAVSDGLESDLCKYYKGEINVIPNMVSNAFLEGNMDSDKKNETFTFFSCSYLTYKKGIDILIRAIKILKDKNIKCNLIVGGDGEERENLEILAAELDVENNIVFKGSLDREEVIYNLKISDAFVLPSRHETFGIVYIEALAMGRPVIMTKTDAATSIIDRENGIVVSKENPQELAEAMIQMIENFSHYNSQRLREFCKGKFSEEAIVGKLNEIYQKLL